MGDLPGLIDVVAREAMLFAAIGFLIGGIDDLAVDAVHAARLMRARWRGWRPMTLSDFPVERCNGRLAVFVASWDEAAVIGAMLRTALARYDHPDYRIYAGAYPNDRATIDAIAGVAMEDARVRLVITPRPGPTTKADCLNALWRALSRDVVAGWRPKGVVLHDAEDVVAAGELRVHDRMLDRADAVQIPVLPLADPASPLVAGHYLDEFAEAHGRNLPVRQALGAGLPLAGVGCAIALAMLERIAASRDGAPFDEASLTEDYELGLTIASLGGRGIFVRVLEQDGGPPVATRAFFPGRLDAAVRQKARWMTGIALAGWDRTGWHPGMRLGDHWMRMRDRRAILAVFVLAAAYIALVTWGTAVLVHWLAGTRPAVLAPWMQTLLGANALLLAWRLALRAAFVGRAYGIREAVLSVPRMVVANGIALLAARRALFRYVAMLHGSQLRWDKTQHRFPVATAPVPR